MNPDIPSWLLDSNNGSPATDYAPERPGSPFRQETRAHLRRVAEGDPETDRAPDPRVYDLVRHLESQGVERTQRIRQWARDICSMSGSMFKDLHKEFSPADEEEVLRLAAYRSEHSYAHFFTPYAFEMAQLKNPHATHKMSDDEHRQYSEMVQLIAPIVADLQPRVAIGFAAQILDGYSFAGQPEKAQAMFEELATKHPRFILTLQDRFKDFPDPKRIFEVAEETRLGHPTSTRMGKLLDQQIETTRAMGRAQ